MTGLLAAFIVGVGTYLSRSIFILSLARRQIPEPVLVALHFVAPAVLASLVVAVLIRDDGSVAIGVPELAALVTAGVVANRSRSHILTLVVGMGVYWITRALV